jgi:hypothetical protein
LCQPVARGKVRAVTERVTRLELDDLGLAAGLPRPTGTHDRVEDVPYRAVEFRDDELPAALERCAAWLRQAEAWLGEPLDILAIHLDYDNTQGSPYFNLKALCNEEDLAGAPLLARLDGTPQTENPTHAPRTSVSELRDGST